MEGLRRAFHGRTCAGSDAREGTAIVIDLDESTIDAAAPNASAIKNGRALVLKNKFSVLNLSTDGDLLFGECKGSGKKPYLCSVDFIKPDAPTYRCSCPSRQFPCKHCLGLMYAYAQGQTFAKAEPPDDIVEKRTNLKQRRETEKANRSKPKKVNKTALKKKIGAQLDGLDLLERLVEDLLGRGLGTFNQKAATELEEQGAQLADAYLPGAKMALQDFTQLYTRPDGEFVDDTHDENREANYLEAFDRLTRLHALVKQGREALQAQLDDDELKPITETAIAAWLGHAWSLAELTQHGMVEKDQELLQLSFHTWDDYARREYVDMGVWTPLGDSRLLVTKTYRPYKAANAIKSEDSVFNVVATTELFVYPGGLNPRIRWEDSTSRPAEAADYEAVTKAAHADLAPLLKEVKNELRSPLGDKHPVGLVRFGRLATVGEDVVLEDTSGQRLKLSDDGRYEDPDTLPMMHLLPKDLLEDGGVILLRFNHNLNTRELRAKPLALICPDTVVRLAY